MIGPSLYVHVFKSQSERPSYFCHLSQHLHLSKSITVRNVIKQFLLCIHVDFLTNYLDSHEEINK